MSDAPVIHVEIQGQRYPIRARLEPRYVQELAAYVDRKMRAAAEVSPSSDYVGLAVLAALNIADEFFRTRDEISSESATLTSRARELERLVDEALESAGLSLVFQEERGGDGGSAPGRPPDGSGPAQEKAHAGSEQQARFGGMDAE
jgi:cell division protein ZapA